MKTEEFSLPDRLTTHSAQEIVTLIAGLGEDRRIVFDASNVEAVEGSAVLALTNIIRALSATDSVVVVQKPTSDFVDAFTDLGLYQDLMKMEFQK